MTPSGSRTGPGTTAHTGSAVPITSQTTPGSNTPAPSVAAMSSPHPRTTWVDGSSPAASLSQGATGPSTACAGRMSASRSASTRKASHASGDQSPVPTSTSIDDEAFEGSTATSPEACQATKEPGRRNHRAPACWSARCSPSQAIFAATWLGSRLQPVSSRSRSGSILLRGHVTLSGRAAIHPDQRRPERLPVCVRGDEPVELRAERNRAQSGAVHGPTHLGEGLGDGRQPLAGILLGPPGLGIRERVGHVRRRDLLAVRGDRLRARALRADVHSDHELAGHSATSGSSPGPRR